MPGKANTSTRKTKPCVKCGATDRYTSGACRPCAAVHRRRWKQNNRSRRRTLNALSHGRPLPRVRDLHRKARNRAHAYGLPFSLKLETVYKWARQGTCAATGIVLDWSNGTGSGARKIRGPSLDRINPKKGYTDRNVQLVCSGYNSLKGTDTDAEAWRFIEQARRNRRA